MVSDDASSVATFPVVEKTGASMALASIFKDQPTTPWLLAYLAVNVAAVLIICQEGELIGDVAGMQVQDIGIVPWALLFLLLSYVLILVFGFRLFMSFRFKIMGSRYDNRQTGGDVGLVLAVLHVGFISFFLKTGTFVAGSSARVDSVWSQVWVLLSTDTLFLVYYGVYRDSRWFAPNLMLALLSNVLRGWSGIFLIIIFFEFCRLIRSKNLRLWHVLAGVGAVVLFYPALLLLKLQIRTQFGSGASLSELYSIASTITSEMSVEQFLDVLAASFMQVVGRLQLLSDVVAITQLSDDLRRLVQHGMVVPFWWEGIHGLAVDRLFGGDRSTNIGVAFAALIDPYSEVEWNANIGYIGWFFILPSYWLIYIAYTTLLALASVILLRRISNKPLAADMLWYAWLVFLVPGWLASYVLFVYSLLVFMTVQRITVLVRRCRWVVGSSVRGDAAA